MLNSAKQRPKENGLHQRYKLSAWVAVIMARITKVLILPGYRVTITLHTQRIIAPPLKLYIIFLVLDYLTDYSTNSHINDGMHFVAFGQSN